MAGRFPGAPDLETFWANLRAGVESIHRSPTKNCGESGVDEQLMRNPRYVKATSVLDGVDLFDAGFFGYAPREAELLDPQHRLFLECAWEALERAGYDPKRYPGLIGVYAGASTNGYLGNIFSNPELVETVGVLQATIGQQERPSADARVVQAESARTERERADGVLDVARGRAPGVPQPRRRRMRHGAGRRRVRSRSGSRRRRAISTRRRASCRPTATAARSTRRRRARSAATASASSC